MKVTQMQDQLPETAGWVAALMYKLLPAGLGAAIMICVDPPDTRRELFLRLFVAFACSFLFGDVVLDGLHSFALLSFLDETKRMHRVAVDAITGGCGWFVIGGGVMLLKRWKADPLAAVQEAKKVL